MVDNCSTFKETDKLPNQLYNLSFLLVVYKGFSCSSSSPKLSMITDKKTWPTHMLPTRDPPQDKRPTQTESEGFREKIFQTNGQQKNPRGSNTHIRQNRTKQGP